MNKNQFFCYSCGLPCKAINTHEAIDCWINGRSGTHYVPVVASDCCGDDVVSRHRRVQDFLRFRSIRRLFPVLMGDEDPAALRRFASFERYGERLTSMGVRP